MIAAVAAVCGSRGEDLAGELPQNRHDVGECGHFTEEPAHDAHLNTG